MTMRVIRNNGDKMTIKGSVFDDSDCIGEEQDDGAYDDLF